MAFTRLSNSLSSSPQPLLLSSGLSTGQMLNGPYTNSNIINSNTASSAPRMTNLNNKSFNPPPAATSSPEIFWRNYVTGEMRTWQVVNGIVANIQTLPTVSDFSWQLDATVDFDRDGNTDLLWRNQLSGAVVIWQMQAGQIVANPVLQFGGDNHFTIVGVADFNQDSWADLLSFNYQTGETQIWELDGTELVRKSSLPTLTDPNWRIQNIGDFNNDQKVDILWQNLNNGALSTWLINRSQVVGMQNLPTLFDSNWNMVGVEDLDLDGDLDFLWRNKVTGDVSIWQMQSLTIEQSFVIGLVKDFGLNSDWRLEQVGDFDRDGDYDVLWHNASTGGTGLWKLDKTRLEAVIPLKTELQFGWKIEEVLA